MPTRKYRTPRYVEQAVTLAGRRFRQLYLQDLGHDEPTILLTNEHRTSPKALITRYAQRMLIENALSDAVRFFHMDALSSAVGLKVDFDMTLLVVASGHYRLLAGRMRGYGDAQARQIFRDLVAMPATITITQGRTIPAKSIHRLLTLCSLLNSREARAGILCSGPQSGDRKDGSRGPDEADTAEADTAEAGTAEAGTAEAGTAEAGTAEAGTAEAEAAGRPEEVLTPGQRGPGGRNPARPRIFRDGASLPDYATEGTLNRAAILRLGLER